MSQIVLFTTTCSEQLMLFVSLFVLVYVKWFDSMME